MKRIIYIVAVILTLVIGAVFSARNAAMVKMDFIIISVDTNLSLAIIIALIVGAALGVLTSLLWLISTKRELHRIRKKSEQAQKELVNLRAIPIKDEH